MEQPWRQEVASDVRKKMIVEMYHELLRISGESDKPKVWGSAAKFELMLWSNSSDRNSYMTKMQRKIVSLRRKPHSGPASAPVAAPQTQQQPQQAVAIQQQQQQEQQSATQAGRIAAAMPAANTATTAVAPAATRPTVATATGLTAQQQQAHQWLQRLQAQFLVQQQQLLRASQQETAQLRTQQLQQLAQHHQLQRVSPEQRRQQLQQLQQRHEIARARLQQIQKAKQQQLQRKQQQYFVQKQQQLALPTVAAQPRAVPLQHNPQQQNTTAATVAPLAAVAASRGINPEQLQAAHDQQAQMRRVQRAQNVVDLDQQTLHHATPRMAVPAQQQQQQAPAATPMADPTLPNGVSAAGAAAGRSDASYSERLRGFKTKYWDDVVIVYKEFERMAQQKPAGHQPERINALLMTLRCIIALLQQDPSKSTSNNMNDLDRVEAHIQQQVLPIRQRLKDQTRVTSNGANVAVPGDPRHEQQQRERRQSSVALVDAASARKMAQARLDRAKVLFSSERFSEALAELDGMQQTETLPNELAARVLLWKAKCMRQDDNCDSDDVRKLLRRAFDKLAASDAVAEGLRQNIVLEMIVVDVALQARQQPLEARSLSAKKVLDMCCCPISLEVMSDPVVTPSGISYERAMIERHLQVGGKFDPMTHAKLTKAQLYPNRMLKQLVEATLAAFDPMARKEMLDV